MKIRSLLLPLCALLTLSAAAIPAKRIRKNVVQPDGSVLTICLQGDENLHYFATTDGLPVRQTAEGWYVYADLTGNALVATTEAAVDPSLRTIVQAATAERLRNGLQQRLADAHQQRRLARKQPTAARPMRAPQKIGGLVSETPFTGSKKGLVILVNFTDTQMKSSSTYEKFNAMMNAENYTGQGIGSVHDYFRDQSYGVFDLSFDVAGPYTLSHNMAYYGANSSADDFDQRPGTMAAEACQLANADVDFSDYDWDGDGEVEQVYIIYAGYAESSNADADTIWPHEWTLSGSEYGRQLYLDGVVVDTYACSSELKGNSGSEMDGIGSCVHEFSHCLGLPDFYDTKGSNFGMDSWSVMDYGCYNNDGDVPCGYTAYERWYAGWLTPVELNKNTTISGMQPLTSQAEAYIVYNDACPTEFYLLENRQQESWNEYDEGHGMLIVHVDYDEKAWYNNTVNNNSSRQRLTIIPADNTTSSYSLAGDPFPGTKDNTKLTDTSIPAASLYNAAADGRKYMGRPITNISEDADRRISFSIAGFASLEAPVLAEASDVKKDGFTASWSAVDDAESYTLELRPASAVNAEPVLVLSEDCSGFKGTSSGGDNSTDIGSNLDNYMQTSGWDGYKIFSGPARIKMGSNKAEGTLTSPILARPSTGVVTLSLDLGIVGTTGGDLFFVGLYDSSDRLIDSRQITLCEGISTFTFGEVESDFYVEFVSSNRAYIYGISIYDGGNAAEAEATAAEDIVVEGVTGTSHTFTALPTDAYRLRVKAVNGADNSAWSNAITVDLNAATGIHPVPADGSTANGTDIEIFSIDGRHVSTIGPARQLPNLPAGTYLLRQGQQVKKVVQP